VIAFICLLICVFDPLAVCLVLAFNVASTGKITKEKLIEKSLEDEPGLTKKSSGVTFKGLSASGALKTKK
jgi:hypothetical protein